MKPAAIPVETDESRDKALNTIWGAQTAPARWVRRGRGGGDHAEKGTYLANKLGIRDLVLKEMQIGANDVI